jgi:hypothetical protein
MEIPIIDPEQRKDEAPLDAQSHAARLDFDLHINLVGSGLARACLVRAVLKAINRTAEGEVK